MSLFRKATVNLKEYEILEEYLGFDRELKLQRAMIAPVLKGHDTQKTKVNSMYIIIGALKTVPTRLGENDWKSEITAKI